MNRLEELRKELADLEERKQAHEESIRTVDNMLLKVKLNAYRIMPKKPPLMGSNICIP